MAIGSMQLCGALFLLATLSTACGLRCYSCTAAHRASCTDTKSCGVIFNRCFSVKLDLGVDMVTKGCQTSIACVGPVACCEGNLCNSVLSPGPSVLLLLSVTLIKLFL